MNRGSRYAQNDDSDDDDHDDQQGQQEQDDEEQDHEQQDDEQSDDEQQDDEQQDEGQQEVTDETQQNDDEEEQEQGEEAIDPTIKVVPIRTKSDPLPSQQAARDKADADYHPEVVMLPDSDDEGDGGDDAEIKFTATLDSGCDDNWISWTKMQEHNLGTDKVEALADQPGDLSSDFTDFSGGDVTPAGQVQLRWRATGSGRSEDSVFYVIDNEDAPFDVLFGRTFMDQHEGGPQFFKKPVLINAGKPLSAAEKARKKVGVRGTSAFAEPQVEDEHTSEPAPAPVNDADNDDADQGANVATPAEQHGVGKWGKKLAGGFAKFSHH